MEFSLPPTVCLKGIAVRQIREEKKLTQLYVAKVVGVTPDTISRWENNRYPTVKRENALRLADALEVSVVDLLQTETPDGAATEETAPARKRAFFRWALPLGPFVVLLLWLTFSGGPGRLPDAAIRAERLLPVFSAPGTVVPVRVRLEADPEVKGFILREHFPPGWKLLEASPPASSLDNEEGTARWIVKPGETRRLIVYLVRVVAEAETGQEGRFRGEVVANPDGRSSPVGVEGDDVLEVAPVHWADLDGDLIIDDGEILRASDTVDEMKGVHLEWNPLEKIWDAGGYRWDDRRDRFVPAKPVHPEPASAMEGEAPN